jgi:hypothetical protein
MEHTRLVARLLSEVASARAAITESYVRLWRSGAGSPGELGFGKEDREPRQDPERGSRRDERSTNDVG